MVCVRLDTAKKRDVLNRRILKSAPKSVKVSVETLGVGQRGRFLYLRFDVAKRRGYI